MIYYPNIDLLESCKKSMFFRAYARKRKDEGGFYWNLRVGIDDPKDMHIHELYHICNADTYEELMIWCDMHGVTDVQIMHFNKKEKL